MKKSLALIVKLTISLALLYFAASRVNLGVVAERAQRLNAAWLAAAIALLAVQAVAGAVRWRIIVERCGAAISIQRAVRFTMVSLFFSQVLPSTVGGDAARIWLVARDGAGWAKAIYSVAVDRVVGVLALALIVVICLPQSFALIPDRLARAGLLSVGLFGVAGPAAFIAFGCRQWGLLHRFAPSRHVNAAANVAYGIFASAGAASLIVALSFFIQGLSIGAAWLAARSVASPFDFIDAIVLIPPVLLVATVPISIAGWGVRESAMVMAFSYAGLPQADGLMVSALFGLASFALGIFGGLVWLAGGRRHPLPRAAAAPPQSS